MHKRAFTLVEMLVVLAVITVLAVLALPVMTRTQEQGRATACLSNLHQIGLALQLYVHDNDNRMPVMYDVPTNAVPTTNTVDSVDVVLAAQLGSTNVLRCPSDRQGIFQLTRSSYAWNSLLNGQKADRLEFLAMAVSAHQIPVMLDKERFHVARGPKKGVNYLYADGHIKNLFEGPQ